MATHALMMAVGFATGVVVARCLGPEGRGVVAAVTVYPSMFLSLMNLGVRQATTHALGKGIYSEKQIIGAVSTLILTIGPLSLVVCGVLLVATGNRAFTWPIIVLATLTIPLSLVADYSSGVFLGKRWVGQFTRIQQVAAVQNLVLVLILVWGIGLGVPGVLASSLLSALLVALYALKRVAEVAPLTPALQWPVVRSLLVKGITYAIALFVLTLNDKVDIVLMERLSTTEEIGIYALAVNIAQLTWALPQSITTALFAHSATASDARAFSHKVARLFRVTVILSGMVVALLATGAPILIPLFYGAEFRGSVRVIQMLLPGVFFLVGLKILNMDLAGRGRPNVSLWVTIPSLIVNIGLNLILLPRYGARGAAFSSSISYTIAGLAFVLIYCRVAEMGLRDLWSYRSDDFHFLRQLVQRLRSSAWAGPTG